jgi:hypothetical protein
MSQKKIESGVNFLSTISKGTSKVEDLLTTGVFLNRRVVNVTLLTVQVLMNVYIVLNVHGPVQELFRTNVADILYFHMLVLQMGDVLVFVLK